MLKRKAATLDADAESSPCKKSAPQLHATEPFSLLKQSHQGSSSNLDHSEEINRPSTSKDSGVSAHEGTSDSAYHSKENILSDTASTPPQSPTDLNRRSESDSDSDSSSTTPGESKWLPIAGPMSWVQRQMQAGTDPRAILSQLIPNGANIPNDLHDVMLWKIIVSMLSEPPKRKKLPDYNTMSDFLDLITKSNKIIVLTGAGVSVSCGIPDFRSRDGLYARLAVEYPDLPNPQAMFGIDYFKQNPYPFFKFAKEIYPGKFSPSPSHLFIKSVEDHGKLLRNYTQNIDTLEQVAGIKNIIQCHGSFAKATCMNCKRKVTCEEIKDDIMNQKIPHCTKCKDSATENSVPPVIKPDIVFFGESLPAEFHEQIADDKAVCDLLIVIGSSLKVQPVSLIPNSLPAHVPQVLINREPLRDLAFDIELLGDCDTIIQEVVRRLSWPAIAKSPPQPLKEIDTSGLLPIVPPPLPTLNDRFGLRLPTEIDQSLCSADTDMSQISSCKLALRGDYVNPMEGSQLSSLKTLRVNQNTTDQSNTPQKEENLTTEPTESASDAAHTGPSTVSGGASNSQATPSTISHTTEHTFSEHTFSGKLDKPADPIDSLAAIPGVSPAQKVESKRKISSRLPENTFLFMPPNTYVFSGAELLSDDDDESDADGDDLSSISASSEGSLHAASSSHADILDTTPAETDSEMCSDRENRMQNYRNRTENERVIDHDEDAFDAFPHTSSQSSHTHITQPPVSQARSTQPPEQDIQEDQMSCQPPESAVPDTSTPETSKAN